MVRVNLLPPEIIEKRKAERRWVWVAFGAIGLAVVLAVVLAVPTLMLYEKQADLEVKRQEAAELQAEAERYKIFEDKQADLQARQAVADTALSGRISWSRLFSELSLVLPNDVWLTSIQVDETTGLTIQGGAQDSKVDSPDTGHKAMAKMLVRLADLDQLTNVWLTGSEKKTDSATSMPFIEFTLTSSVSRPATPTASSVPAPPVQPAASGQ